jgi:hypothetical protein
MWQFSSAAEYYQVALRLDNSLEPVIFPMIERLKVRAKSMIISLTIIDFNLYLIQSIKTVVDDAKRNGLPIESIITMIED